MNGVQRATLIDPQCETALGVCADIDGDCARKADTIDLVEAGCAVLLWDYQAFLPRCVAVDFVDPCEPNACRLGPRDWAAMLARIDELLGNRRAGRQ